MKSSKTFERFKIGLFAIALTSCLSVVSLRPSVARADGACSNSGSNCFVGGTGPNGGIIFYDAGSQQWWGRYLEAEQTTYTAHVVWGDSNSIYPNDSRQALQRRSMGLGMGRDNTRQMRESGSPLASLFGASDWYLPSKDELDALYDFRASTTDSVASLWKSGPMWTSSESEDGFAWYQLFQDGTQFTDAQGISTTARLKTNKKYLTSPKHVGSSFTPMPMQFVRVRSFPNPMSPPAATLVTSVRDNPDCSTKAINCAIGDKGPAGGIIVYDAGSDKLGARYYEIAPQSCELTKLAYATPALGASYLTAAARLEGKAIGAGAANSARLLASKKSPIVAQVAKSNCNGFDDWFVPSKGELNEAFRQLSHSRKGLQLTPVGGFQRGYYWTSSDYNGSTAWTQYFADGQQFDRVQTLTGNVKPPARPFYVRPMRRFNAGEVVSGFGLLEFFGKSIVLARVVDAARGTCSVSGVTTGYPDGATLSGKVIDFDTLVDPVRYFDIKIDWRGNFASPTELQGGAVFVAFDRSNARLFS